MLHFCTTFLDNLHASLYNQEEKAKKGCDDMRSPQDVRRELLFLADSAYRDFQSKLMPTVEKTRVMGVRAPVLHKYEKSLTDEEKSAFLAHLPHGYYDEDLLHVYVINGISDFSACLSALSAFLPYLDNWATCDSLRPKVFARHTDALFPYIENWLASPRLYICRFAIGLLLTFYLGDAFQTAHLAAVSRIRTEEYYLQMMQAWYFATALDRQYDEALPYFTEKMLPPAVYKLAVRKACESHRIPGELKAFLRSL